MKTHPHRMSDYMVALIGGAGIGGLIFSVLYLAELPGWLICAAIAFVALYIDVKVNP